MFVSFRAILNSLLCSCGSLDQNTVKVLCQSFDLFIEVKVVENPKDIWILWQVEDPWSLYAGPGLCEVHHYRQREEWQDTLWHARLPDKRRSRRPQPLRYAGPCRYSEQLLSARPWKYLCEVCLWAGGGVKGQESYFVSSNILPGLMWVLWMWDTAVSWTSLAGGLSLWGLEMEVQLCGGLGGKERFCCLVYDSGKDSSSGYQALESVWHRAIPFSLHCS